MCDDIPQRSLEPWILSKTFNASWDVQKIERAPATIAVVDLEYTCRRSACKRRLQHSNHISSWSPCNVSAATCRQSSSAIRTSLPVSGSK
mmetsp:Transcript_22422/g.37057  ORF Transcript_22422/g.37057 Transcript_22422/m.37057 type:complete len:90 (+) Transcript_22422:1630-1899(+)